MCIQNKIQIDINQYIDEFVNTHLPNEFAWRANQRELIERIALDKLTNESVQSVVGECPTGSGKSVIALCLSYIFCKFGLDVYILTSDVSLQIQYEEDIEKFGINWASVKGKDRYLCPLNSKVCSAGDCIERGKSISKMACNICPYLGAIRKGSTSSVTVMNYAAWISHMIVSKKMEEPPFKVRQIVICDEAHKISDFIQTQFSPVLSEYTLKYIEDIKNYLNMVMDMESVITLDKLSNSISEALDDTTIGKKRMHSILYDIITSMNLISLPIKRLKDNLANEFSTGAVPDYVSKLTKSITEYDQLYTIIGNYMDIIRDNSADGIIINRSEKKLTLNCLYDHYLMSVYFHPDVPFGVYLSATIGDPRSYFEENSLPYGFFYRMPSVFNFEKSPIYFCNSRYMSYNQIDSNMPWMISQIEKILDIHTEEMGMIHSASYKLTNDIINGVAPKYRERLLKYNNTNDKQTLLNDINSGTYKRKVLIGPSLIEGVNLPDDKCRFIIFAKVPYMSLTDEYVKAKKQESPKWYTNKTVVNVLQGVGRGVRSESDWCDTYILDANFNYLLTHNISSFPSEFIQRIKPQKEI